MCIDNRVDEPHRSFPRFEAGFIDQVDDGGEDWRGKTCSRLAARQELAVREDCQVGTVGGDVRNAAAKTIVSASVRSNRLSAGVFVGCITWVAGIEVGVDGLLLIWRRSEVVGEAATAR